MRKGEERGLSSEVGVFEILGDVVEGLSESGVVAAHFVGQAFGL